MQSKKFLKIFLIITLVCSITPATAALQTDTQTDDFSDDMDKEWNKGMKQALDMVVGEENYELTSEQDEYLDKHADLMINKGEGVLTNLQDYLNFLFKELNKYGINTHNTKNKRDIWGDKFTESIYEVTQYLKDANIPVESENYNYETLRTLINGTPDSKYRGKTLLQIKDLNKYVVYVEVVSINDTGIVIKGPKQEETWKVDDFTTHHMINGKVNIIIVPKDDNTAYTLKLILEHQKNDLKWSITIIDGLKFLTLGCGFITWGIGVSKMGWVMCKSICVKEEVAVETTSEIVHIVGENDVLIPRYKTMKEKIHTNSRTKKCASSCILIVLGMLIMAVGGFLWFSGEYLKNEYNTEINNLNKWEWG